MKNKELIDYKKMKVLKTILKGPDLAKLLKEENETNTNELILKNIELYEPITFENLVKLNKKRMRNAEVNICLSHLKKTLWHLNKAIEKYKSLINKTEYWERRSTYDFNFKDWNTLKKANGKLTRYYNDICNIKTAIELEGVEL